MPLATSSVESGAGQDGSLRALEARVRRKLDLRILPLMSVLYLFNFLDRTSIGNAKIAGLVPDAKLNGTELNTALTVFYVLYMVCQIPSNWVLKKVGANRWLALMACAWSIISIGTGFVQNFGGLVTLRFLLGGFEGTILPGMILYMSMLYPRHELQTRIALFWSPATVAGAFGGLLAAGIIKMDGVGGLAGWRWIFILEGIATFLIGILFWLALPRKLENMTFLTPEERDAVVARLKVDIGAADLTGDDLVLESGSKTMTRINEKEDVSDRGSDGLAYAETAKDAPYAQEQFEWREVLRGLSDIKIWLVAVSYFGVYVAIFSLAYFIPTLIAGLGYSGSEAQLRTVPPYVVATGVTVIVSYIADRMKMRLPMVLVMLPIAIAGYAIAVVSTNDKVRYGALFLMILGVYPTAPAVLAFVPNNKSGHYCRGTAVALYIGVSSAGGFMSTFVYTPDQAPHYIKGHSIVLSLLCASFAIIGVTLLLYIWENKVRAEGRRNNNITEYKALWDAGLTRAPIGDRHPDFRYTL